MEQQNIDEAVKWLKKAAELGNAEAVRKLREIELGNIKVGSVITFGHYPKNNGDTPESIEWRVLKVESGRALVISKYALDGGKPYHEDLSVIFGSIAWEHCTMRKWLNNNFINIAFTQEEQQRIILVNVPAHSNPDYNTNPGNDTQDKIFLLSVREAREFFKNDDARICYPTNYAKKQGVKMNKWERVEWWLRSPGGESNRAVEVVCDGGIYTKGNLVPYSGVAIRPAFYLNLNS